MFITKSKATLLTVMLLVSIFLLPATNTARGWTPLFHITLMVPEPNPTRQAWSEIIQNNFKSVGIDVDRVIYDWDTIYSKALTPPEELVGKTFDEGGYDLLFVGNAMGIDPEPGTFYDSSQFAPNGQNFALWNNSENDRLCRLITGTVDEATRLGYVREWQKLAHEEEPDFCLFWTKENVAFDPTLLLGRPFEVYHYPVWPATEKWILNPSATEKTVVLAQTGPCPSQGLNQWLSTSYYDLTVAGEVIEGLAIRNDTEGKKMLPGLAVSWEVASDQKTWTVHLRHGVKWHDGVEFTAEDVKFSYEAAMAEELASPVGAFVTQIVGSPDNIVIVDDYTVKFNLPAVYSYFVENILAAPGYGYMIPKHVLADVPYAEWKSHLYNMPNGADSYVVDTPNGPYTAWGPIGTGPYVYAAYDPTTFTNILTKNPDYWNKQALEADGLFQVEQYYVQYIEGSDAAISALKAGTVDILDSQYHLETKLESIQEPWGDYVSYEAFGVQQLTPNLQHPIFGTGVDTPLGKQDPSKAAEAAHSVRLALSHLIPRQQIIDTLLNGYGTAGVTVPITSISAGYDPSIEPYAYDVETAKSLLEAAGYDRALMVPPPSGFLEEYGLYVAVAVVVVVVAVGAVYFIRRRKT
jgi:ABC-type transport system substrate-binding protein